MDKPGGLFCPVCPSSSSLLPLPLPLPLYSPLSLSCPGQLWALFSRPQLGPLLPDAQPLPINLSEPQGPE